MRLLNQLWQKCGDLLGTTIFHPQFFSYRYLVQDAKEAVRNARGVLLDVGCGRKPYEKIFRPHVEQYYGLDHPGTPEQVVANEAGNPEIYAGVDALPIRDECIDTILLTQVLEHIDLPEQALGELYRVLRPGGRLLLSVPMLYPIHSSPHDYFRFTKYGLHTLLTHNGFQVEQIKENGGFIAAICLFINIFLMHKVQTLMKNRLLLLLALPIIVPLLCLLIPFFNFCGWIFQPLDTERRFCLNYFVVAVKQ